MDKVKIKLLIIDDEKDIRDSLKDILIDEGYEIPSGFKCDGSKKN